MYKSSFYDIVYYCREYIFEIHGGSSLYPLIFDVSVVAILIAFAFSGYKSGIFKSFLSFISTMFSGIFSVYIANNLSRLIYINVISPQIQSKIQLASIKNFSSSEQIFNLFSPWFVKFLGELRITPKEINHIIVNGNLNSIPCEISELLYPLITGVLKSVLAPIMFVLLLVLVNVFARCISKLFRINFLKTTNSLVGMIFGILKGYIIVTILICCLRVFVSVNNNFSEVFSPNNISSTVIFKEIYNNNFIYSLYKKI